VGRAFPLPMAFGDRPSSADPASDWVCGWLPDVLAGGGTPTANGVGCFTSPSESEWPDAVSDEQLFNRPAKPSLPFKGAATAEHRAEGVQQCVAKEYCLLLREHLPSKWLPWLLEEVEPGESAPSSFILEWWPRDSSVSAQ
jgi:hypothetical protein